MKKSETPEAWIRLDTCHGFEVGGNHVQRAWEQSLVAESDSQPAANKEMVPQSISTWMLVLSYQPQGTGFSQQPV